MVKMQVPPMTKTVSRDWLKRLYMELVNIATAPYGESFPSWILNVPEFDELRRIVTEPPDEATVTIPSPSALCGLLGCTAKEPHDHEVLS
jgi:hypothetical protein